MKIEQINEQVMKVDQRMNVNLLVTYRIENASTGEVIEDDQKAAYVVTLLPDTEYGSMDIELIARRYIPTTLLERAKIGDSRFAYDMPTPWIEITSLALQAGDSPIYTFPKEKILNPKQVALMYQRKHLREFWDGQGINYKEEAADLKKIQH